MNAIPEVSAGTVLKTFGRLHASRCLQAEAKPRSKVVRGLEVLPECRVQEP